MNNLKKYTKKIIKILSLKELRILPAYLAYSLVLAIIPIITIVAVIAGYFSISIATFISFIEEFFPSYLSSVMISAISGNNFDVSIGLLNIATFLVAANGMYAIINISNDLYKIDSSSVIKDRLKSFLILLVIIILILFLLFVPILGDKIITLFYSSPMPDHILRGITLLYNALKWPLSLLIIFFDIKIIYIIAPSSNIKSSDTTIGALISTIGITIFTAIFGYYINYFGKYDIIYGSIAGIIIVLIWFYVLSYILILGIIINTRKYNNKKETS